MPVWSSGRLPDGEHQQDEGLLGMGNDFCGVYVGCKTEATNPIDRALRELDDNGEVLPMSDGITPRTRTAIHDLALHALAHQRARNEVIKQHVIGALAVTLLALGIHEAWMAHAPLGYMVFLRGVVGVIMSLVYCNLNGLPLQNSYHQAMLWWVGLISMGENIGMTVAYSRLPLLEATVLTSLTPVWASLFLRANYGYPVPVVVAISILPLSLAVLFVLQPWVSWHDHIAGDWLGVAGATCGSIFHSIDAVLTRRLVYGGPSEHPENSAVVALYRSVAALPVGLLILYTGMEHIQWLRACLWTVLAALASWASWFTYSWILSKQPAPKVTATLFFKVPLAAALDAFTQRHNLGKVFSPGIVLAVIFCFSGNFIIAFMENDDRYGVGHCTLLS